MPFEFGCRFTWPYFLIGMLGGLAATLVLPGSYTALPRVCKVKGEWRMYWGFLARLVVSGIFACVVDNSNKNAFFSGFFAWHACKWAAEGGWQLLRERPECVFTNKG